MYEKFNGSVSRWFAMRPGPYLLYWGRTDNLAHGTLEYGFLNEAGLTVIIVEIGCGRATLRPTRPRELAKHRIMAKKMAAISFSAAPL
jgi:hypothetical protein